MRVLNIVMDWIDYDERTVSMESETDTSTSASTLVKERLRVNQNLDISTSSLSSHMWNNRLSTDAQKIYLNIMEDMRDESDQSSGTPVEMRDIGIQISLSSETEEQFEPLDMSMSSDQEFPKIVETSVFGNQIWTKVSKRFYY